MNNKRRLRTVFKRLQRIIRTSKLFGIAVNYYKLELGEFLVKMKMVQGGK